MSESIALVYHWPLDAIANLTPEDFLFYAAAAERRLKAG